MALKYARAFPTVALAEKALIMAFGGLGESPC